MHADDAQRLHMAIGDLVDVSTDTGTITMPIEISQDIMQGVVSIPHGFGHKKKGVQLRFAASDERAGVSVNDITDHNRICLLYTSDAADE